MHTVCQEAGKGKSLKWFRMNGFSMNRCERQTGPCTIQCESAHTNSLNGKISPGWAAEGAGNEVMDATACNDTLHLGRQREGLIFNFEIRNPKFETNPKR